jgi:hypothetical protein
LKPEILPVNIKMKTATGEISSCLGQIAVDLKLEKWWAVLLQSSSGP